MSDHIELRGLRVLGTHGALPEEQSRPQPFEVDLDVEVDLALPGTTDALVDTVDYAALVAAAHEVVATEHHVLLEAVAERIAEEVGADPRVRSITVAVRKLRPLVPVALDTAGVRITRPGPVRRSEPGD